jgi:hypothetical protein
MTKTPGALRLGQHAFDRPRARGVLRRTSSYLLCTKYNDYAQGGGQGINKVAVLDPTRRRRSGDRRDGDEGDHHHRRPDARSAQRSLAVREWCINACAIDPITRCAMVNSEDGKLYAGTSHQHADAADRADRRHRRGLHADQ